MKDDDLYSETKTNNSIINSENSTKFSELDSEENKQKHEENNHNKSTLLPILVNEMIFSNKLIFILSNLSALITSSIQIYMPKLLGNILDGTKQSSNEIIIHNLKISFVLVLIASVFAFIRAYFFEYLSEKVYFKVKQFTFNRLINHNLVFFENNKTGEITSRFLNEIECIKSSLSENLSMLIRNSVQLILGLVMIFYIDFYLTIKMIFIIIPSVYVIMKIGKSIKQNNDTYNNSIARSNSYLNEIFYNIKLMKSYNANNYELNRFGLINYEIFTLGKIKSFKYGVMISIINLIAFSIVFYILYYGALQVKNGEISLGELSSFFIYATTISVSLMTISSSSKQLINAKSAIEKIDQITSSDFSDENDEIEYSNNNSNVSFCDYKNVFTPKINYNQLINDDPIFMNKTNEIKISQIKDLIELKIRSKEDSNLKINYNQDETQSFITEIDETGNLFVCNQNLNDFNKIEFRNVDFSYNKDSENVLKNVNLEIFSGQKIGIVGESGSGKSSLINLILKFYNPSKGSIYFDNQNINVVNTNTLRNSIGYVSQDVSILSGSILSNILYGYKDNNSNLSEDLKEAIQMSQCNFLYDNLMFPNGLNTEIGEKGSKISGGQKQRIAIARALIRNPKLLIFDEATASLDSINESIVNDSIQNVIKNKKTTVVIVSHSLNSIKNCDNIFVLKNHTIVGSGKHEELSDINNDKYSEEYCRIFSKSNTP